MLNNLKVLKPLHVVAKVMILDLHCFYKLFKIPCNQFHYFFLGVAYYHFKSPVLLLSFCLSNVHVGKCNAYSSVIIFEVH